MFNYFLDCLAKFVLVLRQLPVLPHYQSHSDYDNSKNETYLFTVI